jgi:putative transposase
MWFAIVTINVEELKEVPVVNENQVTVGADFGITSLITLSDGVVFENPRALKSQLKSLTRQQRILNRKEKGSENWKKQYRKYVKLHYRIVTARKNAIHQATSNIVKNYDKIVIEDLDVTGLQKNKHLARSIGDASFYEVRRQLEYKTDWAGKELVIADRFYPSSKLCSNCDNKKNNLSLNQRTYICTNCGLKIDRDLNAAKNLADYSPTTKTVESYASGEWSTLNESPISHSVNEELKLTKIN